LFIDILQSLKVKRCNTYFSTCYKLVNLAIRETRRRIEKNSKKKNISLVRHYQAINSIEIHRRNRGNLNYVLNYFKGYIQWLKLVKKL